MLKILLIRPGTTDFDEQGRIKGTLDIPLSDHGTEQVAKTVGELSSYDINTIYAAPCKCCEETAAALRQGREANVKTLDGLKNLDHGLWHGKRIEEVKQQQPKVYRQWQEHPETVCPPQGESLASAQERVQAVLAKVRKKHKDGVVALIVPEPLTSVVRSLWKETALDDLWKAECDAGGWELLELEPGRQAIAT
jgi:broad specificity phosphatase PhoE